jgi:hypothetical protein
LENYNILISFDPEKSERIMEPKWYTYFNYGSIALVAVLLLIILTNSVPKDFYIPLLIVAIIVFILRIIFRIIIIKKSRERE